MDARLVVRVGAIELNVKFFDSALSEEWLFATADRIAFLENVSAKGAIPVFKVNPFFNKIFDRNVDTKLFTFTVNFFCLKFLAMFDIAVLKRRNFFITIRASNQMFKLGN